MSIISSLLFLGVLGIFLIQSLNLSERNTKILVLALSLYFIFSIKTSGLHPLVVVTFVIATYAIGLQSEKTWLLKGYITLITSIFLLFKIGVFESVERNPLFEKAAPIGLSFLFFHSIAYLVEKSRSKMTTKDGFLSYSNSALFFPVLPAGPFYKPHDSIMIPSGIPKERALLHGYCLIVFGIFKIAISGFLLKPYLLGGMPLVPSSIIHPLNTLLLGSIYLFSNFSGYSDMVVGISKMMGFEIPINFKFPYLSTSVADYWQKWHISLGRWFGEYVFHPLSYFLARQSRIKIEPYTASRISMFFTFLLIGLWHQFSYKILLYAFVNAFAVIFFQTRRHFSVLSSITLTFPTILFINGIFLSKDIEGYVGLLASIARPASLITLDRNLHVLAFSILLLTFYYFIEKQIDKLSYAGQALLQVQIIVVNFIISAILLFLAISIGFSDVTNIYVGY